MNVEIISVGTELLLGDIYNLDAQIISKELALMGFNVYHHTVVGDNAKRLEEALEIAKNRADIIITTGGLGPTYDDLTKEIIAKTFNRELVFNKEAFSNIEDYFKKNNLEMIKNQEKQAYLPENSTPFQNAWGTAPGCGFKEGENYVLMLPGPPRECEPMFINRAKPYLASLSNEVIEGISLKVFGLGEAYVEELLFDKMTKYKNPSIAPFAKFGECVVRITAKADSSKKALSMIEEVKNEVLEVIGEYVYGVDVDNLEHVVTDLLKEKNITISTAESCTGGLLAKRITDFSGVSSIFMGGVCTYSNEAKKNILGVKPETLDEFGAVSEETAREMAFGVTKVFGTDVGVSITGVAGPTGGTIEKPLGLVYVCVYFDGQYYMEKITGYRNRESTRMKASSVALDMIRKIV